MKPVIIVLLLVGVGFGIYTYMNRPKAVPPIILEDNSGNPVTLTDMMGSKQNLLVVFISNKECPMSKFSLELIQEHLPGFSSYIAVAGISFSNQQQAEKLKDEMGISFPVFGIKDAKDPITATELIELVGFTRGSQAMVMVWGGTVFLMDMDGKLQFLLEKEEVRELPEKLSEAVII